jgi:hypothetical protein
MSLIELYHVAAQKEIEREIVESKESQMDLSSELLEEYNDIKLEYGTRAAALEAELAALTASAQADEESLRIIEDFNDSVDSRMKDLGAIWGWSVM